MHNLYELTQLINRYFCQIITGYFFTNKNDNRIKLKITALTVSNYCHYFILTINDLDKQKKIIYLYESALAELNFAIQPR